MQLKGSKGAKPIINKNISYVKAFINEKAAMDIDTQDNYNNLMNKR